MSDSARRKFFIILSKSDLFSFIPVIGFDRKREGEVIGIEILNFYGFFGGAFLGATFFFGGGAGGFGCAGDIFMISASPS